MQRRCRYRRSYKTNKRDIQLSIRRRNAKTELWYNKIFKIIGTISFIGVFTILIITLYNNITLNNKNKELEKYLTEYKELKKEIDNLNNFKKSYDIAKLNNENLNSQKEELESEIKQLNNKISNLNKKIDKLK